MSESSVPEKFSDELRSLKNQKLLRSVDKNIDGIDFYSNDYLGLSLQPFDLGNIPLGATGSRLISGNYPALEELESFLAQHHHAEAALVFPSGYQANVGFFQAISSKEDLFVFDEQIHASIRDGMRLAFASRKSFSHNNLVDLENKLKEAKAKHVYVIVESLYSMSGEIAPLDEIISLCERYRAFLIVDEAHSNGIYGKNGEGLIHTVQKANACMARIYGFGKAIGCQGACIVGSDQLKELLINKHRGLIYSTGISPLLTQAILHNYSIIQQASELRQKLKENISQFNSVFRLENPNESPIKSVVIPDNELVMKVAEWARFKGLNVKGIRSPSVTKGSERIRIVLHSFNTFEELEKLYFCLSELIKL